MVFHNTLLSTTCSESLVELTTFFFVTTMTAYCALENDCASNIDLYQFANQENANMF